MERIIGIVPSRQEHVAKIYPYIRASLFNAILPVARSRVYSYIHYNFKVDDAKPGMELCRAVAPSGAIKVNVKAKAMQEAQKAKAQARKGSIPIGMIQQSYSRGAHVSASASSASAATVSSTKTQHIIATV
jgi:hypothetical protein